MRKPRRDGDRYEKYLEGEFVIPSHIRIWDADTGAFVQAVSASPAEIARRVSGSGSSVEKKGDLKSENYLIQAKRTDKESFTVKLDDLRQAEREAMNLGKKPLFIVGFYENDRVVDEWVFMPKWMFGG